MTKFLKARLGDSTYLIFLATLLINVIIFWVTSWPLDVPGDFEFFIFCLHYATAVVLFFTLMRSKQSAYYQSKFTIMLLTFLVSAFALNRVIPVFKESASWLCVALLVTGLNMLLFHLWNSLPVWAKRCMSFMMGAGMLLLAYFALYLMPLYGFSVIGLLVLGISIHTFVPAFLIIHNWNVLRKTAFRMQRGLTFFITGAVIALAAVAVYATCYRSEVMKFNRIYNRTAAEGSGSLPTWIEAMQRTSGGFMEDKVLKSKVAYLGFEDENFRFFPDVDFGSDLRSEKRCHDPLITIASATSPALLAPVEDRYRILASLHQKRHDAQERFWTGKDLYTQYVNTRVKIWPKLHLAYTEKMLTVVNREFGQQEAIYTFHLPEGGVVTSLSLWINGKEEKAILTTKEKADTAYRNIVGRERRDPSLAQWQEGNTVSVRVFPVAGKENRRFRIGFTAPLSIDNNEKKLHYDNISFEGPSPYNASEDVTVQVIGQPERTWSRSYKEDWNIELQDVPIEPNNFSFNGNAYTLQPYTPEREAVHTDKVYLDVNAAWTEKEFEEVLALAAPRPVYVWLRDELIKVERGNKAACIRYLRKQRFSMFPLFTIRDPEHALLITKSTPESPSLDDLDGSEFKMKLSAYLAKPDQSKIRLLNIGDELSPYLKSLKEFRVFRYEKGGILLLKLLLDNGTFAKDLENDNRIVIDQSNMMITRSPAATAAVPVNTAPDHLLRLFNYNHIMQQTGKGLITGSAGQDSLVAAAKEAYVVSPLSSLIVLETQKDYDRFDIRDDGNSLRNASMKSTGAVPEPHEWALIILALLTLLYVKFKNVLWNRAAV